MTWLTDGANFEVAECDSGKARLVGPVASVIYVGEHLHAVGVVSGAQPLAQEEELAEYVEDVEHFDEQVQQTQVVAVPLGDHTEDPRQRHPTSITSHVVVRGYTKKLLTENFGKNETGNFWKK